MNIRKATLQDLPTILSLFHNARQFMRETGNPDQWNYSYPDESIIQDDINRGCSYLCFEEDTILASFYYAKEIDPTYTNIYEGSWLNEEPYAVIHRIATNQSRRGIAAYCYDWAYEQLPNLKIDTHRENVVMQKSLQKNGFTYCGIIHLESGDERLAYQRI